MENQGNKNIGPLYDKKFKCSYCEHKFMSKKVRSRYIKPLRVDRDFGPIFKPDVPNPMFYYVAVCPECGFSFTEDFSDHLSSACRIKIDSEIKSKWDKSDYCGTRDMESAIKTYKLAIYTAELAKEKHIVFANLCLRLAWIYRNLDNRQEENRFLELACNELESTYMNSDFEGISMTEIQVLYLIGKINRRLGNYNEAVKYFTTVIEHPDKSAFRKYVNLAREQWKLTVEEYREQKSKKQG